MGDGQPQPQPSGVATGSRDNIDNDPTQAIGSSQDPVESTSKEVSLTGPKDRAPDCLKGCDLSVTMQRYLSEAPQDGGSTYDLVHADLDARFNALRLASELQFANQGRESK